MSMVGFVSIDRSRALGGVPHHDKPSSNCIPRVPEPLLSDVAPFCGFLCLAFVLLQFGDGLG